MRINTSGVLANQKPSQAAPEAAERSEAHSARESGADNVTVSARARLLALGRSAFDAAPAIRTSAVEAARAKLDSGADASDGGEIARAMIDAIADSTPRTAGPDTNADSHVSESR